MTAGSVLSRLYASMLTREDILQFLRDNKERFAEQYGVTKIGLFGSFARFTIHTPFLHVRRENRRKLKE